VSSNEPSQACYEGSQTISKCVAFVEKHTNMQIYASTSDGLLTLPSFSSQHYQLLWSQRCALVWPLK